MDVDPSGGWLIQAGHEEVTFVTSYDLVSSEALPSHCELGSVLLYMSFMFFSWQWQESKTISRNHNAT